MVKISEMTNKQLEDEYISYDEMINVTCCYGTNDLFYFEAIEKEIHNRGGQITYMKSVDFPKEDLE